jgi:hypothetical protein
MVAPAVHTSPHAGQSGTGVALLLGSAGVDSDAGSELDVEVVGELLVPPGSVAVELEPSPQALNRASGTSRPSNIARARIPVMRGVYAQLVRLICLLARTPGLRAAQHRRDQLGDLAGIGDT